MNATNLRSVPQDAEPPKDVAALLRADILKRDWAAVMVWGDKQRPVEIDRPRKGWR